MNQVLYWNAILLEASRRDHSQGYANGQQSGPTNTSRAMAIVHLAIHDAVAYVRRPGAAYLKKKKNLDLPAPNNLRLEDVIDGAAFRALGAMYPAYGQYFNDSLGAFDEAGFNFGVQVADAVLQVREDDGANAAAPLSGLAAYGKHRVDPYNPSQGFLGSQWGSVQHFVGPRTELAPFPGEGLQENYPDDEHYLQDFEEVREFGALERRNRTAEQTVIGVYWAYDGAQGIGVPPRLYNQIARKIVANRGLNIARTAELFAEINVAMADAGIDAWHWKYEYDLWRPVVGIRDEAPPHGDPFWAPYGAPQTNRLNAPPTTPQFPAYPSGHATFGAALFQTLRLLSVPDAAPITVQDVLDAENGGNAVEGEGFSFVSDELDGRAMDADGSVRTRLERAYTSYARAIWENAVSRVYLGVHWRFDGLPRNAGDNIGGVPLGLAIGEKVHAFFAEAPSLGGA